MSAITLSKAIDEYLSTIRQKQAKSVRTIGAQTSDLRHVVRHFTEILLTDITKDSISDFFGEMVNQQRYSPATINRFWLTTVSFFNFCSEQNYIRINPLSDMKPPVKAEIRPPTVLTKAEIRQLLLAPVKEYNRIKREYDRKKKEGESTASLEKELFDSARNRAIVELLFATGMRASEAANLKKKDFNFHNCTVTIKNHGGKKRIGYFPSDDVKEALQAYTSLAGQYYGGFHKEIEDIRNRRESREESQYFFHFRNGKPLGPETVRDIVRRCAREAGIKKTITPYTLRHTLTSFLLAEGVNIYSIQRLLGITDVTRFLLTAKKK
ncbi:hypothetical protein AMJ80_01150 [bacterium SM23_31]|nr:MAG: hypothetical protein AMJ80_01150 [bacterium SM23_31]